MAWFINNAAKEYCISSFSQKTRNNIDNLTFGSYDIDMVYNSERVLSDDFEITAVYCL